ncbi:MAG: Flp pilus assembly complex ATPase component TadA, partial [Planctomycetes bacterium]|nr:Flp pilus assembly complex ATPase component TadA [Planctomycetota bacterium]
MCAAISDVSVLSALLKRLTGHRKLSKEDFDTVVAITIQKVVEAVGAEAITVFLSEDEGIRFAHIHYAREAAGGDPERAEKLIKRAGELKKIRLRSGEGIVGAVIGSAKSDLVEDARKDPRFASRVDSETGFETRSMITVPLRSRDKTIGAIQALNKTTKDKRFTREDLSLLEEVAGYTGDFLARIQDPDRKPDEVEMARYVARLTRHPLLPADKTFEPDEKLLKLIGEPTLRRFTILPLAKTTTRSLKIAMSNPLDIQRRDSFALATQLEIGEVLVAPDSFIRKAIDRVFPPAGDIADVTAAITDQYGTASAETLSVEENVTEESAPVVQLANRIIEDAYTRGASDIHVEPLENDVMVRYRVDGICEERIKLPATVKRALVARIKIMSELDISERRLPQDGRIVFKKFSKSGIDIDLRVSTAPLAHGEKVCMRILDRTGSIRKLDQMGFSPPNVVLYREIIQKPYGMILHVGPTGSGKTTTLYAALGEILSPEINIMTIEDPVEIRIEGINQVQVRSGIGLTFASALRSFLRQDPDVIMVGEIRDQETATIAINAALTGHLVFS